MKTFPISLNIRGRRVVVVGGGRVGRRKARAAAEAQGQVFLVDADAEPAADRIDGLTVIRQAYQPGLLEGAFLVFACTDDAALNRRIAADARSAGALVNVADSPADCDFFLPAVWSDGDVVVAVATGGVAPVLAACIRDWIGQPLPQGIGRFAQAVGDLRRTLQQKVADPARRRDVLRQLCTREMLKAFLAEGPGALQRRLAELIGDK
ncbi:MAG: bifunctional precorrin-2 dehydrogenase/sirohydrochlorin ferrochelatase [Phycisphaerae bacterium]|nr:bifunctional precorrin-2 dehydrogenase/sirohydrochlorin ferrochelatase [Phycisphaerae bacterium]